MSATWILVADRAKARLFAVAEGDHALTEIEDFLHPDGRGREPARDRPTRTHDRLGEGRHAVEPHTTEHQKSDEVFARELDAALEHGRVNHLYRDLVLVAPPHFLGALNAALGKQVRACVVDELPKGLVSEGVQAIRAHLPARFHP